MFAGAFVQPSPQSCSLAGMSKAACVITQASRMISIEKAAQKSQDRNQAARTAGQSGTSAPAHTSTDKKTRKCACLFSSRTHVQDLHPHAHTHVHKMNKRKATSLVRSTFMIIHIIGNTHTPSVSRCIVYVQSSVPGG